MDVAYEFLNIRHRQRFEFYDYSLPVKASEPVALIRDTLYTVQLSNPKPVDAYCVQTSLDKWR
jgi:hypothetical protein